MYAPADRGASQLNYSYSIISVGVRGGGGGGGGGCWGGGGGGEWGGRRGGGECEGDNRGASYASQCMQL